eukprot:scaffold281326_cov32-Tisochrysis_lutea.AAC.1
MGIAPSHELRFDVESGIGIDGSWPANADIKDKVKGFKVHRLLPYASSLLHTSPDVNTQHDSRTTGQAI